jgi:hypothetical protein
MSNFEISGLPGGEIVIGRTLTESEDGVNDHVQFLLRQNDQEKLINWLWENRRFEMMFGGEQE